VRCPAAGSPVVWCPTSTNNMHSVHHTPPFLSLPSTHTHTHTRDVVDTQMRGSERRLVSKANGVRQQGWNVTRDGNDHDSCPDDAPTIFDVMQLGTDAMHAVQGGD
jgi:hypothetical protein